MIQKNLIDFYFIKLYKAIRTSSLIEGITTYYLSGWSIDINNYIYQFTHFRVLDNLKFLIIKDMYDQIAISHLSYQKILSLIIWNYYWQRLKKMVKYCI